MAVLITTGLFLFLSIFDFSWLINMLIAGVYIAILLVIRTYFKGGVPSLVVGLTNLSSLLVWVFITWIIYTTDGLDLNARSNLSTVVTTVILVIWIVAKIPQTIKLKMTKFLVDKGLADISALPIIKPYTPPVKTLYRSYKQRRWQKITRNKPNHFVNQSEMKQAVRLFFMLLFLMSGNLLWMMGLSEFQGGAFIWSANYWMVVIGLFLVSISFPLMFSGVRLTLIVAAVSSTVLMGLTLSIESLLVLCSGDAGSLYLTVSLLLMSVGVGFAIWIRRILMGYTLGMMMFVRDSVWINSELLMLECLPIEHYDHLVLVEIQRDDQFDLTQLMKLGPQIELFAHFRKMIFAGIRFGYDQDNVELYFLTKNPDFAKRKLTLFFRRHFHYPFTMSILNDPKVIIDSRLAPTDIELLEATNRNAVMHYENQKVDFSEIHPIIIVLIFSDAQSGIDCAQSLSESGYTNLRLVDNRRYKDEPAQEWNGWYMIYLQIETRIGLERINIVTRNIRDLVLPYNGRIDYWVLGTLKHDEPNAKAEEEAA